MELPILQYKKDRPAYVIAAIFCLLAASFGLFWFGSEHRYSFWAWVCLIAVFILFIGWLVKSNAILLELNHEGIVYKNNLYRWDTFRSYALREEMSETTFYNYLVLNLKKRNVRLELQLKIKLNWLKDQTSVPEQMAAYANHFQITFDGVETIDLDSGI